MTYTTVKNPSTIELRKTYNIRGDLVGASGIAECEAGVVSTQKYMITRRIVCVTVEKVYCECGRVFWLDNLELEQVSYETYRGVIA
jgi:hypothetical protein